jgi:pyruvate/2-oxoglutarate dehydrogenase complex dihydrolipoamide acyltransferase (E2) component
MTRMTMVQAINLALRQEAVDLHQVSPSGPAGRVTAEDVRAFAGQQGKAAEAGPPKKTGSTQPAVSPAEVQPDFRSPWTLSAASSSQ